MGVVGGCVGGGMGRYSTMRRGALVASGLSTEA